MNILVAKNSKETQPLYSFFEGISDTLTTRIFNKFQSYVEYGDVYHCKSLKVLNSKIWKYKGTIYKLRVDNGKESARVLFAKTRAGDLTIIHAFLKSTRKTPAKDAHQAIGLYQELDSLDTVSWTEDLTIAQCVK